MDFYLKPCHLNSSLKDRGMKSQQGPFDCVSWQKSHTHTGACAHAQTHMPAHTPPACLHASESIIMLMSLQSPHVPTASALNLTHTHTHSQTHFAELSSITRRLGGKIMRSGQFHHRRNRPDRICISWCVIDRHRETTGEWITSYSTPTDIRFSV